MDRRLNARSKNRRKKKGKPRLRTEDYNKCFVCLQQLWNENKKKEFAAKLQQSFENVPNPYRLALVCMKQSHMLKKNKNNGMIIDLLNEFKVFVSCGREQISQYLCEDLQKEVFQEVVKFRNSKLARVLVESFQLEKVKCQFVPDLRKLISQRHFRDVCSLAILLNLQDELTSKELTVPLLCQDKLLIADEFLDSSPLHQRGILMFIDDLLGKKPEALHLAEYYDTYNRGNYRNNKMLSKTAAKLIKKYKWDESLFPNLHKRRALGALRFLFHKYYSDKSVVRSAFHSLIEDALKETPSLKLDLMNIFCEFGDPLSAAPYVKKLDLNIDDLPKKIKYAVLSSSSVGEGHDLLPHTSDSQEEFENDSNNPRYTLNLPGENVIYIDAIQDFEKCMREIPMSCVIAVDSEWKPTFGLCQREHPALLQLATLSHVYLIDVQTLMPDLKNNHWLLLGQIFQDPDILKLGYGLRGDFNNLSKLHRELEKALLDVENLIDFDKVKPALLAAEPELFTYSSSSHKGLSDLVYRCFGKPLNKLHQFSNWASRPLSESQRVYAALDVRCLIDIYNYLNERAEELAFGDWKVYGIA